MFVLAHGKLKNCDIVVNAFIVVFLDRWLKNCKHKFFASFKIDKLFCFILLLAYFVSETWNWKYFMKTKVQKSSRVISS